MTVVDFVLMANSNLQFQISLTVGECDERDRSRRTVDWDFASSNQLS